MAKKKSKDLFGAKPPKSSMTKDYVLEFEYMKSPHEESWWDPGMPHDSRGHQHGPNLPKHKGKDMDKHYDKGEDYD